MNQIIYFIFHAKNDYKEVVNHCKNVTTKL